MTLENWLVGKRDSSVKLAPLGPAGQADGLPPVAIRAKSGTMNYARGLAGVIEPGDGRRLVFAVFVNDQAARAALDGAASDGARAITGQTRAWLDRARALERDLLTHWVNVL